MVGLGRIEALERSHLGDDRIGERFRVGELRDVSVGVPFDSRSYRKSPSGIASLNRDLDD